MDFDKTEKLIHLDEGFRDRPYRDSAGHLTIGYGWNLDSDPMPEPVAALFTHLKIQSIDAELTKKIDFYATLDDVRKAAICNMCYQMGAHGFLGFDKTIEFLRDGNWKEAAIEAHNSDWAKKFPMRSFRICKMIETGDWPAQLS